MWSYQPRQKATQGLIMVDMEAAITVLMKKWADGHSLSMKEKAA